MVCYYKFFERAFLLVALYAGQMAFTAAAAQSSYTTGENIVLNGNFERNDDRDGVPDSWTRSIQMPGAKAEVALEKKDGGNCIRIRFMDTQFMLQARVFQDIKLVPDKVYELSFQYKSEIEKDLKADIMLTGSGPIFRNIYQEPVTEWTRKKFLFSTPSTFLKDSAGIYVQNRSTIPIWYDDISLRETDIKPDDLKKYQPQIIVQSVSSEDQLIIPGTNRQNAEFLIRIEASEDIKSRLYAVARLLFGRDGMRSCEITGNKIMVPVNIMPDGSSRLSVLLFDRSDNALVSSANLNIEKISADMIKGNLDLTRAPVFKDKAGRPFFPIGMYGLNLNCGPAALKQLRDNGFNTIHCYSFEGNGGLKSPDKIKDFLDLAQKNQLKVTGGLPRDMIEKKFDATALNKWLDILKNHPATLFYYSDEMYGQRHSPISSFKSAYEAIKQADPKAQWIPFENPEEILAPYMDGIMVGIPSSNAAKLIRMRLGENKPVFSVFGQDDYNAETAPAIQNMQYYVFMPVILGARGVYYWWYPTLQWHNKQKDLLRERLYSCTKILAEAAPALVSGEPLPEWAGQIKTAGSSRYCSGALQDNVYIIAGGESNYKDGTVEFRIPSGWRLESLTGIKVTPDSNGQCRFSLKEKEIAVLKVTRQ